jgi:hypothetical protein
MSVLLVPHVGGCPRRGSGHTDESKRMADIVRLHLFANSDQWSPVGKWIACQLEDGRSPDGNTLYDTKQDAVRHTDYMRCVYIRIHPGGTNECETEALLKLGRSGRYRNFLLADPDSKSGGPDIIPRIGMDKIRNQIRALH